MSTVFIMELPFSFEMFRANVLHRLMRFSSKAGSGLKWKRSDVMLAGAHREKGKQKQSKISPIKR